MLHYALVFFVIALVAAVLGFTGIAAGAVEIARAGQDWETQTVEHGYAEGNHRIIGAADMALAIRENRPHRASGDLALHVLEVMEAFQVSSDEGRHVTINSRPERPAAMPVAGFA